MNTQPVLNDTVPRLLRLQQVGEITGLRRSMIYQLEADGNFPRRVKLATRAVGWVESEIRDWIAARIMIRDGHKESRRETGLILSPAPSASPNYLTIRTQEIEQQCVRIRTDRRSHHK